MSLRGAWGVAFSGVLVLAGVVGALAAQEGETGIPLGTTPPAVTIEDLDGKPVELAPRSGKEPVLIEFWATWCALCRALEPRMKAAHARYGDRVKFVAVAVAVNENPPSVRRHLTAHPMPFPFLWDTNGNAARAFQVPATSYVVVLDRGRKVRYTGIGADQDLETALAKAVAAN
jgi:thiol-disulfide isomerase/thioredoxin